MTLVLVALGLLSLALPGLSRSMSLRGDPRWSIGLISVALGMGLVSIIVGLGVSVVVGVLHLVTGAALVRYEGHITLGGIAGSALSGALLACFSLRAATIARRAQLGLRAARPDRWLGHREPAGDHELVVIPTSSPVAYSVTGSPSQVVVSEGLRDRLGRDLLELVIDHERAHLSRRHRRPLLLAAVVDAVFGRARAVRRSTAVLRLAVERAADEEAAGSDGGRRTRLAVALQHLGAGPSATSWPAEVAEFRIRELLVPSLPGAHLQFAATLGLIALAATGMAVGSHAMADLPDLLGQLR